MEWKMKPQCILTYYSNSNIFDKSCQCSIFPFYSFITVLNLSMLNVLCTQTPYCTNFVSFEREKNVRRSATNMNKYNFIVMQLSRAVVICHSEMKLWAQKLAKKSPTIVQIEIIKDSESASRKKLLKNSCE